MHEWYVHESPPLTAARACCPRGGRGGGAAARLRRRVLAADERRWRVRQSGPGRIGAAGKQGGKKPKVDAKAMTKNIAKMLMPLVAKSLNLGDEANAAAQREYAQAEALDAKAQGLCKHIGVSNFERPQIEALERATGRTNRVD